MINTILLIWTLLTIVVFMFFMKIGYNNTLKEIDSLTEKYSKLKKRVNNLGQKEYDFDEIEQRVLECEKMVEGYQKWLENIEKRGG